MVAVVVVVEPVSSTPAARESLSAYYSAEKQLIPPKMVQKATRGYPPRSNM